MLLLISEDVSTGGSDREMHSEEEKKEDEEEEEEEEKDAGGDELKRRVDEQPVTGKGVVWEGRYFTFHPPSFPPHPSPLSPLILSPPSPPSFPVLPVERLTTAALLAQRQEKVEEKMATIAELASSLVEGPEENVSRCSLLTHLTTVCYCLSTLIPLQVSNVQKLLSLCTERDPEVAVTVRKMAMASLMTVFKDIAPR